MTAMNRSVVGSGPTRWPGKSRWKEKEDEGGFPDGILTLLLWGRKRSVRSFMFWFI